MWKWKMKTEREKSLFSHSLKQLVQMIAKTKTCLHPSVSVCVENLKGFSFLSRVSSQLLVTAFFLDSYLSKKKGAHISKKIILFSITTHLH